MWTRQAMSFSMTTSLRRRSVRCCGAAARAGDARGQAHLLGLEVGPAGGVEGLGHRADGGDERVAEVVPQPLVVLGWRPRSDWSTRYVRYSSSRAGSAKFSSWKLMSRLLALSPRAAAGAGAGRGARGGARGNCPWDRGTRKCERHQRRAQRATPRLRSGGVGLSKLHRPPMLGARHGDPVASVSLAWAEWLIGSYEVSFEVPLSRLAKDPPVPAATAAAAPEGRLGGVGEG